MNNDVHAMFSDLCNNEGVTIAQKIKQLVIDQIALLTEYEKDNKVEPEFTQSKDELGEYMKMLMSVSMKNNHAYNQSLVKMTFDPYLKDLKQSITDLNTKFEQKIDLNKPKKKMGCIPSKLSCSRKFV